MVKTYSNLRAGFKNGDQKKFLLSCLENSEALNLTTFSRQNKLHPRVLKDWHDEAYRMPHPLVKQLSKKYHVDVPTSYCSVESSALRKISGVSGGNATFKKYGQIGNPKLRLLAWKKWWQTKGKYKPAQILQQKKLVLPRRSHLLAEFIGIMLGDGGLTEYQTRITLNKESDEDYIIYVKGLIYKLFKENTSIIKLKTSKAVHLCVSRKKLTLFLVKNGLFVGNKVTKQVDIPKWIKENSNFLKYCIRGLFDTDGGVFFEKHHYKDNTYSYIRFSFVNKSKPLLFSVQKSLASFGIPSRLNRDRSVTIEGLRNVSKYFTLVGTSNLKHLHKYEVFRKLDKTLEKWQSGLSHSS